MLEQEIKSDIEERQRLMLQIKTLYLRYEFNEKDEELFLTYSIPAVYALWEGFVQTTFRTYIQQLNALMLTVDTVCEAILIHHIESKFPQFREYPTHTNKKMAFFGHLNAFYTSKSVEIRADVNTESNVGFDVLNRLLRAFNLEPIQEYPLPRYSVARELTTLLRIRNAVAHGNHSVAVGRDYLNDAIKLVEILMDLVLESVLQGFSSKSYLKVQSE
ncbi:hypothetical protein KFZ76_14815 [Methylovulum psychrotolerans]|uniref:MAE_28990/MAE_18760 family HEPN-like nuclease n=1 Tax=Methylovulum psychrotolerans TaxID=1704499 RepID=UPI001BFF55BE|nr:MAE_28990/MAE_18760 family HEPN-like nuclease [Methylovulum psychrotolerans]MBT9098976.1 hypothetical protein [Methylovulum psychrotolerans]